MVNIISSRHGFSEHKYKNALIYANFRDIAVMHEVFFASYTWRK